MDGKIETYEEAARVIELYLKEFCSMSLPYPEMIADAARRANFKIDELRCVIENQNYEIFHLSANQKD